MYLRGEDAGSKKKTHPLNERGEVASGLIVAEEDEEDFVETLTGFGLLHVPAQHERLTAERTEHLVPKFIIDTNRTSAAPHAKVVVATKTDRRAHCTLVQGR